MSASWRDVIQQVMLEKGVNQIQLSQIIQKSQSTLSHWLAGTRTPPLEEISNIMKRLGIKNLSFDDSGNFWRNDTQTPVLKKDSYTVDVLNVHASAGTGVVNTDVVDSIRSIEFSGVRARQLFGGIPESSIKVVTVKGDSMSCTIEAGDLVYLDVSKMQYDGDGIYVFIFGDTLFIKRLQRVKDRLLVISDNKHYAQWEVLNTESDQLFIQGKVLLSQTFELKRYG